MTFCSRPSICEGGERIFMDFDPCKAWGPHYPEAIASKHHQQSPQSRGWRNGTQHPDMWDASHFGPGLESGRQKNRTQKGRMKHFHDDTLPALQFHDQSFHVLMMINPRFTLQPRCFSFNFVKSIMTVTYDSYIMFPFFFSSPVIPWRCGSPWPLKNHRKMAQKWPFSPVQRQRKFSQVSGATSPSARFNMNSLVPSGYVKIAIENGHRNSGFTHWKWWIFP